MKTIKYEIKRSTEKKDWVLYKIVEEQTENSGSLSFFGLFWGSKKECQEKKKEIEENVGQRKNSNVKK